MSVLAEDVFISARWTCWVCYCLRLFAEVVRVVCRHGTCSFIELRNTLPTRINADYKATQIKTTIHLRETPEALKKNSVLRISVGNSGFVLSFNPASLFTDNNDLMSCTIDPIAIHCTRKLGLVIWLTSRVEAAMLRHDLKSCERSWLLYPNKSLIKSVTEKSTWFLLYKFHPNLSVRVWLLTLLV